MPTEPEITTDAGGSILRAGDTVRTGSGLEYEVTRIERSSSDDTAMVFVDDGEGGEWMASPYHIWRADSIQRGPDGLPLRAY
jgi:hypothetical protein